VLDDGVVSSLTVDRLDGVLRPKVDAVVHLDELTRDMDLAAFVVFSSIAGQIGGAGQGNYAAGNAFLDGFATWRSATGRSTTSIAWGPWVPTGGMTAQLADADVKRMSRGGIVPLSISHGLALFDAAVDRAGVMVTPMALDVAALGRQGDGLAPLLRGLVIRTPARRTAAEASTSAAPAALRDRLTGRPAAEQHTILLDLVRTQAALVLGYADAEAIDQDQSLLEIGFDSLTAVELRNRLGGVTGLRLPSTLVFDQPTPSSLAAHLAELVDLAPTVAEGAASTPEAEPASTEDGIAALFRTACRNGQVEQGFELLRSAAALRPAFGHRADFGKNLEPVRLTTGPGSPAIVCFSSFVALAGVHQYARLAANFRGETDVWALSVPGFLKGERLPKSREVVIEMQAAAVLEAVGEVPFVLVGSSGGGLLAHAAASLLEDLGAPPAAVVLLDTYPATEDSPLVTFEADLIDGMFDRQQFTVLDASRLTAMSRYFDLFGGWEPAKISAPTLLVRASEPIVASVADTDWQASWEGAHTVVDVPGTHFTMMESQATTTARAVREWLAAHLDF
jgi:thioesterase domain-containing protein/acyl carrier protein